MSEKSSAGSKRSNASRRLSGSVSLIDSPCIISDSLTGIIGDAEGTWDAFNGGLKIY